MSKNIATQYTKERNKKCGRHGYGISYAEKYGARCKYIKVVLEDDEHED